MFMKERPAVCPVVYLEEALPPPRGIEPTGVGEGRPAGTPYADGAPLSSYVAFERAPPRPYMPEPPAPAPPSASPHPRIEDTGGDGRDREEALPRNLRTTEPAWTRPLGARSASDVVLPVAPSASAGYDTVSLADRVFRVVQSTRAAVYGGWYRR